MGVTLLVALLHEIVQPFGIALLPAASQALLWSLALAGLACIYLVYSRLTDLSDQRLELETHLAESYERLEAIFQLNQSFVQASEEVEIIRPLLHVLAGLTGAIEVVFVPLDEHGQPQTAFSHRDLPASRMDTWTEYLASPSVRLACSNCDQKAASHGPPACPLLQGPFSETQDLICLLVRRGEREFGIVSLLFSGLAPADSRTLAFLHLVADEVSLGLEGVQLRRRELDALRRSQVLRYKADLKTLLTSLLENILSALDADFAILVAPKPGSYQPRIDLVVGDLTPSARPLADGVLQSVMTSGEPVLVGDVAGGPDASPALRSLLAAPLFSSERSVVGAVLVGNCKVKGFHQRQIALLQAITGQVALVVQNADLMAELEYKTLIQERVRLAREIHDGLAQTLGLLKLQAAQLRGYLARNELERARQHLDLFYATLTEAYQDARQAIDGLRISPAESGLTQWIEQTLTEFQEVSGLPVELRSAPIQASLPPEVHAQLIRILQEALSNVRKHARAKQVWVACQETASDLVLEVRDDGDGFSPEDLAQASKHGLQGMQERAELIGAALEIISHPGQGAVVRLCLPLSSLEAFSP